MNTIERFNNRMDNYYYPFLEENTQSKFNYLNDTITKARDALVEIQSVQADIRFCEAHDEQVPPELKKSVDDAVNHLEGVINNAEQEINQSLQALGNSSNPKERIIALRNGYSKDLLVSTERDPQVICELIKYNQDDEKLLMLYTDSDSVDVKKELLKINNETVLSVLAKDDNIVISDKATTLLERLQAFNELEPFDKLLLIAQGLKDWDVKYESDSYGEYIEFERYANHGYDFIGTIKLLDKVNDMDGLNEQEAKDYLLEYKENLPEILIDKLQEYYDNYDPNEMVASELGGKGTPDVQDILADMNECDMELNMLVYALHDAYYNDNYDKHINLTQVHPDDLKMNASKDDKEGKSEVKNTVERD